MKVAYMNQVSERSLMMLNDLLSPDVYPGQIIKLPIPKDDKKKKMNKNHVDLKKLEKERQDADRNTNKKGYTLEHADTGNFDRIDLSEFKKAVSLKPEEI